MARKASSGFLAFGLAVALALLQLAAAADHAVGGSSGWIIPPSSSFYEAWAKNQTFKVGDKLVFRFKTGAHSVLRVTKANYGSCGTSNDLETHTEGPTTVTLSKAGTYYYICGIPGHCSAGQKVMLTVGSGKAAAAPSPSSSSPAPAAGGPGPVSSPGPSTTGGAPSPGSPSGSNSPTSPASTPEGGSPSAGSRASVGGFLVVMSMAVPIFLRI